MKGAKPLKGLKNKKSICVLQPRENYAGIARYVLKEVFLALIN
jgi:hypothetical protein